VALERIVGFTRASDTIASAGYVKGGASQSHVTGIERMLALYEVAVNAGPSASIVRDGYCKAQWLHCEGQNGPYNGSSQSNVYCNNKWLNGK
jgi:hypothetical protein